VPRVCSSSIVVCDSAAPTPVDLEKMMQQQQEQSRHRHPTGTIVLLLISRSYSWSMEVEIPFPFVFLVFLLLVLKEKEALLKLVNQLEPRRSTHRILFFLVCCSRSSGVQHLNCHFLRRGNNFSQSIQIALREEATGLYNEIVRSRKQRNKSVLIFCKSSTCSSSSIIWFCSFYNFNLSHLLSCFALQDCISTVCFLVRSSPCSMLRQKFNAEKMILVMLYSPSEVFRHFFLGSFWSPLVTMITSVLVKNTT
jgi:hypothetical protein